MVQNKGLIFTEVPTATPIAGQHLKILDRPIDLDNTTPPANGLLVKNHYASFDPYQRGRMRDASVKSYSPPYQLNEPVHNSSVVTVLKSGSDKFSKGDVLVITGMGPTEEYSIIDPKIIEAGSVRKLDNPLDLDPKLFLGVLGMPGLTAYSSFYDIAKPTKGETIFISAASGAVGALVGQLAKHEGMKVIGSVGDKKKLDYILNELGFDGGFVYKDEKPADGLKRLAPNGIDVYFENVGGDHLEAAIDALNNHGRIVACGMISQYNKPPSESYPIRNMMNFVAKRLTMRGFIVGDPNMGPKYASEHQKNLQKWIKDGSFKAIMHTTEGIDNAAEGLLELFSGKNFGKAVLSIAPF